MSDETPVLNPLSLDKDDNPIPLSKERAKFVRDMKEIRRNSRNAMRSGNPAKRAEAKRINEAAPRMIRVIYEQEAQADRTVEALNQ